MEKVWCLPCAGPARRLRLAPARAPPRRPDHWRSARSSPPPLERARRACFARPPGPALIALQGATTAEPAPVLASRRGGVEAFSKNRRVRSLGWTPAPPRWLLPRGVWSLRTGSGRAVWFMAGVKWQVRPERRLAGRDPAGPGCSPWRRLAPGAFPESADPRMKALSQERRRATILGPAMKSGEVVQKLHGRLKRR